MNNIKLAKKLINIAELVVGSSDRVCSPQDVKRIKVIPTNKSWEAHKISVPRHMADLAKKELSKRLPGDHINISHRKEELVQSTRDRDLNMTHLWVHSKDKDITHTDSHTSDEILEAMKDTVKALKDLCSK